MSVRFQCRNCVLLFRIVYLYFVLRRNEGLMDQFAACIRAIRFIFLFLSFLFSFFFFLFRGGAGPALFVLVPDAHLRNKNPRDLSGNSNGYSNCDGFCNSSMDKENSINDSKKLNNDGMNYLPSWNWIYRRKTKETGVKDKSRFYSVFCFLYSF